MYPVLKEGVSIGTFKYNGSDTVHYYIANANGEKFEIDNRLLDALLQADGTRPLDLPDNGKQILPKLKKHGLVQTSRFVHHNGIFNRFILFPVGNKMQTGGSFFKAINAALPAASILIFALGVFLMVSKGECGGYSFNLWLYCGLIVLSIVFHELGHLIAGLSYGYKISDIGILLLGMIPIGAYVAHEYKKDATKSEKIQFALSGVEMNLLIAGICLLLVMLYYQWSLTLISVANVNVALAGINLLPASGFDGEYALSAICGADNIGELSKKCLFNKKCRHKLLRSGLKGYACICVFSITLISKAILGAYWTRYSIDSLQCLLLFSGVKKAGDKDLANVKTPICKAFGSFKEGHIFLSIAFLEVRDQR